MRLSWWSLCLGLVLWAPPALGERTHVVSSGHTLGKIAERYQVTVVAVCNANGIQQGDPIRPGQKLVIPDKSDKDGEKARQTRERNTKNSPPPVARTKADEPQTPGGLRLLDVPGAGQAYYYEPTGPGRLALRPVIMYLHGRGGHPEQDCRRWAQVARPLGWLVCPIGPGAMGDGRGWNNSWLTAHSAAMASLAALRQKYGRRVQLYGNTLVGFSEGAYAAMNVGVREPRAFNRWLILAGNSTYWGALGRERLASSRDRLKRVYLITGEQDGVLPGTLSVRETLREARISTRITTPKDMGHELKLEAKSELYRAALVWLSSG